MKMRVKMKALAPSVENGERAELRAEALGVPTESQQRSGSGTKEEPVEDAGILKCQWSQFVRDGENDVEVLDVENLPLSRLEPGCACRPLALGAVPIATGVVHHDLVATALAPFDVTTEGRRSAIGERIEDLVLLSRRSIELEIFGAVVADDIGHFGPMFAHLVEVV
jgi:hypothetical protein